MRFEAELKPMAAPLTCPGPEAWEKFFENRAGEPDPALERHLLHCDACLGEATELLRDRRVIRLIQSRERRGFQRRRTPGFVIAGGQTLRVRGMVQRPGPVFRSGARAVIHSDIIPLAADYVILELVNDGESTRLKLEKGTKNINTINISLYINDRLSDNLQLQRSHSWDLGLFPRGAYTLDLDSKTVLKFELRE